MFRYRAVGNSALTFILKMQIIYSKLTTIIHQLTNYYLAEIKIIIVENYDIAVS